MAGRGRLLSAFILVLLVASSLPMVVPSASAASTGFNGVSANFEYNPAGKAAATGWVTYTAGTVLKIGYGLRATGSFSYKACDNANTGGALNPDTAHTVNLSTNVQALTSDQTAITEPTDFTTSDIGQGTHAFTTTAININTPAGSGLDLVTRGFVVNFTDKCTATTQDNGQSTSSTPVALTVDNVPPHTTIGPTLNIGAWTNDTDSTKHVTPPSPTASRNLTGGAHLALPLTTIVDASGVKSVTIDATAIGGGTLGPFTTPADLASTIDIPIGYNTAKTAGNLRVTAVDVNDNANTFSVAIFPNIDTDAPTLAYVPDTAGGPVTLTIESPSLTDADPINGPTRAIVTLPYNTPASPTDASLSTKPAICSSSARR